jgi:hypothetical protein
MWKKFYENGPLEDKDTNTIYKNPTEKSIEIEKRKRVKTFFSACREWNNTIIIRNQWVCYSQQWKAQIHGEKDNVENVDQE